MSSPAIPPQMELLLHALRDVSVLRDVSLSDWDQLLRFARVSSLLPKLAVLINETDFWTEVPEEVHWHIQAELETIAHSHRQFSWELDCLSSVLENLDLPFILLKGGAYLAAELPSVSGRVFNDLDVLVPESALNQVENTLRESGWIQKEMSPRDAKYFRRWLHEVPPLRHHYRSLELDLHHTILPRTDTLEVDPNKLFEQSIPIAGREPFRVLSPEDMILHASAHLFRNGDFNVGLRDLLDIHILLRHFSEEENFWPRLFERASELDLQSPCEFALKYCKRYFETPLSADAESRLDKLQHNRWLTRTFDRVVPAALIPNRLDGDDHRRSRAMWLMSHYPLPRLRAMLSPLFWIKRLPMHAD